MAITVRTIRARVAEIEQQRRDDESAHSWEDRLWADVLSAIASGAENPEKLAAAALETQKLDFARWCA